METAAWHQYYLAQIEEYVQDHTTRLDSLTLAPPAYVLSPTVKPASFVETALAAAHAAATTALVTYKKTHPEPSRSKDLSFSPKSTEASFGQWQRNRTLEREHYDLYKEAMSAAMTVARTTSLSPTGLVPLSIPYLHHLLRVTSREVLIIESCKYVYEGYEWLKAPASEIPMTPVKIATFDFTRDLAVQLDAPVTVLALDAAISLTPEALLNLLLPINAYIEKSRERNEAAAAMRSWATSLSKDQIDELNATNYVLYERSLPTPCELAQARSGATVETQEEKELAILDNRLLRLGLVRVTPSTSLALPEALASS